MTETQNKMSTATASLFNVGTALDDKHAQLIRIGNMLYVFGESMDEEVRFLQEHKAPSHFARRYEILVSLLDTAHLELIDVINEIRVYIDEICDYYQIAQPAELAEN